MHRENALWINVFGKTENLPSGQQKPEKVVDKVATIPQAEEASPKSDVKPVAVPTPNKVEVSENGKDRAVESPSVPASVGMTPSVDVKKPAARAPREVVVQKTTAPSLDPEEQKALFESVLRTVMLPAISQAVAPVLKKIGTLEALVQEQELRVNRVLEKVEEVAMEVKDTRTPLTRIITDVKGCNEQACSAARIGSSLQRVLDDQGKQVVTLLQTVNKGVGTLHESVKALPTREPEVTVTPAVRIPQAGPSEVLGENDLNRVRKHRHHRSQSETRERENRSSGRKTVAIADEDGVGDKARRERRKAREESRHKHSSDSTRESRRSDRTSSSSKPFGLFR